MDGGEHRLPATGRYQGSWNPRGPITKQTRVPKLHRLDGEGVIGR
jgi:hypothetical protein